MFLLHLIRRSLLRGSLLLLPWFYLTIANSYASVSKHQSNIEGQEYESIDKPDVYSANLLFENTTGKKGTKENIYDILALKNAEGNDVLAIGYAVILLRYSDEGISKDEIVKIENAQNSTLRMKLLYMIVH
jgi:hypothetical protein